jgi:hypothetical protein
MLKQDTQEIDGLKFTCTQFPAMRGFTLLGRLIKTIGPAISVLSSADAEADIRDLAPLIAVALKDLDPDAATALAADVLAGTSVIMDKHVPLDTRANIDMVFSGKLGTMFKVLAFAVKLNYEDFFGGIAPSAEALPATPQAR